METQNNWGRGLGIALIMAIMLVLCRYARRPGPGQRPEPEPEPEPEQPARSGRSSSWSSEYSVFNPWSSPSASAETLLETDGEDTIVNTQTSSDSSVRFQVVIEH